MKIRYMSGSPPPYYWSETLSYFLVLVIGLQTHSQTYCSYSSVSLEEYRYYMGLICMMYDKLLANVHLNHHSSHLACTDSQTYCTYSLVSLREYRNHMGLICMITYLLIFTYTMFIPWPTYSPTPRPTQTSGENLIQNGCFNDPYCGSGFCPAVSGNNIKGWNITAGTVEQLNGFITPQSTNCACGGE